MLINNSNISKLLFCIGLLIGVTQLACSQTYLTKKTANGKAKRMYDRGIQYNKNGLWNKAIKDFESAIKITPNFIDAHYQLAATYYNQKMYEKAKIKLKKVISINAVYQPKAHYYLGYISREMNEFENAVLHFDQFLSSNSKSTSLRKKATLYLANCQFAVEAIKNPVPYDPKPLESTINTSFPEYLPSVTAEGNTLVFTRRINGNEEVFISKKENGDWLTSTPLEDINTIENEGSQYISADGSLIVFVRCSGRSGYGGCDLYFSEKKSKTWTKPKNMGQPINTRSWESQPSLSADGKTMYYASDRKGSIGGRDIWKSYRNKNGEWSNPINLGKKINTPSDDEAPFFHPDGKTLYFMSSGHPGMGGYDLFLSKKEANGSWGIPQNLGYPINTKGNEGALFITLDGTTAYFAKDNLPEEDADKITSRKQPDIFTFELPESLRPTPVTYLKATVKDAITTKKLANASIEVIDLLTNEIFATAKTDNYGNFLTCLPMGGNYALNVNKEKYLFHSENFELLEIANLKNPFLLKIKLQPISTKVVTTGIIKVVPIILKNVFFESGSAKIKKESLSELNHLKDLLASNVELKIQINGHTDNVGGKEKNLSLSKNRARAVKNHLIAQGIEAIRLSHKGFGENQPIDSNETEKGRKSNRRTEFIII